MLTDLLGPGISFHIRLTIHKKDKCTLPFLMKVNQIIPINPWLLRDITGEVMHTSALFCDACLAEGGQVTF